MNKFLLKILDEKGRVIIPDFGAFIIKQKNPKTIIFNEFLQYNDGALIDAIAKEKRIERNLAVKEVNEFTSMLRKKLESNKEAPLEGLGTLTLNATGKITLMDSSSAKPNPDPAPVETKKEEVTPEAKPTITVEEDKGEDNSKTKEDTKAAAQPGKSEVKESAKPPKIAPKQTKKIEVTPGSNANITSGSVSAKKDPTPKASSVKDKDVIDIPVPKEIKQRVTPPVKEYHQTQKSNKTLTIILWVLVILLVNGSLVGYFIYGDEINVYLQSKKSNRETPVTTTEEPLIFEEPEEESTPATPQEEEITTPETVIQETVEEEVSSPPVTSSKYYIVAGVFRSEQNAANLAAELKERGYNAEKFGQIGSLYAVCYDVFPTKAEADSYLRKIQAEEDPEAWIKFVE